MPARRFCECRKKSPKKFNRSASQPTFEQIEWLRKRVCPNKLIDRTVRMKYLVHPSEMNEHQSIKKVFNRFDEDGNSNFLNF